MENYIRCYDNVVSDEFCDNMIHQFESLPEQYEKHSQGEMSFTQIHLLAYKEQRCYNLLPSPCLAYHYNLSH